jgi:hypothetical protein
MVDTPAIDLSEMVKDLTAFLRDILHVNPRSFKAMLYSETGIMPIKERRLVMTLQALKHYTSGEDSCGPLVWAAFSVSVDLARRGFPSWVNELQTAINDMKIRSLPSPLELDWLLAQPNIALIEAAVRRHAGLSVYEEVLGCSKVPLLHLRARRMISSPESFVREGSSINEPQPYLFSISSTSLRKPMLRFLLNEHRLRCELGVWDGGSRHCRLCGSPIESEIHALFICEGSPALLDARKWLEDVRRKDFPTLPSHFGLTHEASALTVLDLWLSNVTGARTFWPALAKLCLVVLSIFDNL